MLSKAVLCVPARRAKQSNARGTAAFTLDRLNRWEAGGRLDLWNDAPMDRGHERMADTPESRATRAIGLCREGMDGKACAALIPGKLADTSETNATRMQDLHPRAQPVGRSPLHHLALPPDLPPDLV